VAVAAGYAFRRLVRYKVRMPSLATLVGSLAARVLGGVLLVAAWAKAVDPARFTGDLMGLFALPTTLAQVAALAVIGFEAGLGTVLLAGWRGRGVRALTSATFLVFTGIVLRQMLAPGARGASCGCFGMLVERTPREALVEDLVLLAISGVAWLGPTARAAVPRWWLAALGAVAGVAIGLAAPYLPLDDHATALAPGMTVEETGLDQVVPELRSGRHLVLLLDRADPDTVAAIGPLDRRLGLPGGATPVWGVAAEDPALAAAFMWSAGPAFEVRSTAPAMLRRWYRTLPRSALVDDGRVVATWKGFPPDAAQEALSRGELP
jgi:Methylamine utilisation protein MauE